MVTNEFEYYLIESDYNYMSPLLRNDDYKNSGGTTFLDEMIKIDLKKPIFLVFNSPIPPKPEMTDYLDLECRAVFSKKIYDVLKDIEIKDFQLISAIITGNKGEEYKDYWIANIYKEFSLLDKDKSEYDSIMSDGQWNGVEKMVIDKELMAKIPLEERLIYVSGEDFAYVFYHKSIVDAIMSVNPTGVRFIPVEEWEG